ncbi:MAG: esterase family protein [Muribaculaceae bacterium]|nr:esterase family protein [Muribaculaceae bacterium]
MKKLFSIVITCIASVSAAFAAHQGDTLTIASKYIDPAMNVVVVTPEGYNDPANADRHYPVVYLLHGYSDNYKCWPDRTQPALDSLATHWNMIFVCPDGRNSWYFDSKLNPKMQMESFITRDLVPHIDKNYRTIADPAHRAITGLSMGGHGALWLAMRHSDIWGNAGATSGGVDFLPWPNNWNIPDALGKYDDNKDLWEHSTVLSLVPTLKPGQLNIIFDCGVDDFFHQVNANLHNALVEAKIPHDYISRPGSHTHEYWRNAILFQLQYFNEQFKK